MAKVDFIMSPFTQNAVIRINFFLGGLDVDFFHLFPFGLMQKCHVARKQTHLHGTTWSNPVSHHSVVDQRCEGNQVTDKRVNAS